MPFVPDDHLRERMRPRRSVPGSAVPCTEPAAKRLAANLKKAYAKKHARTFAHGVDSETEAELKPVR